MRFSADGAYQWSLEASLAEPVQHNLTALTSNERELAYADIINLLSKRPFNLADNNLFHVELILLSDDETLLVFVCHHLICDGWSWNVIFSEMGNVYSQILRGENPVLVPAPSYTSYIIENYKLIQQSTSAMKVDYWVNKFSRPPQFLELPTDRPRSPLRSFSGDTVVYYFSPEISNKVKQVALENGVSLFILLFSAFTVLLSKLASQKDILISSPAAGQLIHNKFDLVGCCIEMLPLRSQVQPFQLFSEFLQDQKFSIADAWENLNVDISTLLENSNNEEYNRTPPARVSFNLDRDDAGVDFSGLQCSVEQIPKVAVIDDIFFNVNDGNTSLKLDCDYNTDLFNRNTIIRWIECYEVLLSSIIENSTQEIHNLSILPEHQIDQIFHEFNPDWTEFPDSICIHEAFDLQARRRPNSTALIYEKKHVKFSELNTRSNKLANFLIAQGVSAGQRVAIFLNRDPDMLISMLGIMKAGALFVPLDTRYPVNRIHYMLKDAQVQTVVSTTDLLSKLDVDFIPAICLDQQRDMINRYSDAVATSGVTAEDAALVIYTSASTGNPVGVVSSHRAHMNRFHWMWSEYPFDNDDVCCQKTSISFVDSIWEIFGPLLKGIPLVLLDDNILLDAEKLTKTLNQECVTRLLLVPSVLEELLELLQSDDLDLPYLRLCMTSGEELLPATARRFCHTLPHSRLLNLYGTSEIAGDVTCYEISDPGNAQVIALGKPICNTKVYVLDEDKRLLPIGSVGDIYVGGVALAIGYLNNVQLDNARFHTDPFSARYSENGIQTEGLRLFQTGDLGYFSESGDLHYCGRRDNQIQLHGIRIDRSELENQLLLFPDIREAVVERRVQSGHDFGLVAYYRASLSTNSTPETIREFLRSRVPAHMLPRHYVELEQLPLMPNGKIDRVALPLPDLRSIQAGVMLRSPESQTELDIHTVWSETLGLRQISTTQSYFDIGDSLRLLRIIDKTRKQFGIELKILDILANPTIQTLAAFSDSLQSQSNIDSAIAPNTQLDTVKLAFTSGRLDSTIFALKSLTILQPGTDKTPIVLIPPAGVTETYFIRMLSEFDVDTPLYTFNPSMVFEHKSISSYVNHLIEELKTVKPTGPYVIAGMCLGTILAYEMAQQLKNSGDTIELLALIDHFAPANGPGWQLGTIATNPFIDRIVRITRLLTTGNYYRLLYRAKLALQRHYSEEVNEYLESMQWQYRLSRHYTATPYRGNALLIQSEDFAVQPEILSRWKLLINGTLTNTILKGTRHQDFSSGNKKQLCKIADILHNELTSPTNTSPTARTTYSDH